MHSHIVKLDATDSTNVYLKDLMLSRTLDDFTVVVTKKQRKGRGQRGTSWASDEGKNLTFSVLKKMNKLPASDQFLLSIYVSMAIYRVLKKYNVPNLSVKWPNDILSAKQKICGILIENVLVGSYIDTSIIGIGLNVNQTSFEKLPRATSLKLILGKSIDLDDLLNTLIEELKNTFLQLDPLSIDAMYKNYVTTLFRKDKPSTFRDKDQNLFMGFIRKVDRSGKLIVALEDNELRAFDLKEIELLY